MGRPNFRWGTHVIASVADISAQLAVCLHARTDRSERGSGVCARARATIAVPPQGFEAFWTPFRGGHLKYADGGDGAGVGTLSLAGRQHHGGGSFGTLHPGATARPGCSSRKVLHVAPRSCARQSRGWTPGQHPRHTARALVRALYLHARLYSDKKSSSTLGVSGG